jgi:WD40 repeat protein
MDLRGHARVWDAASGQLLTPLLQPADFSERSLTDLARQLKPAASFSPDGKLLLLAGGAKSAQLRDAVTGSLLRQFPHEQLVYHAAFSPDARLAATSSQDGTARVWDVATGRPAGPPLHHDGPVAWAQFSSDGNKLMTVRERHFVQLWDWRAGRRLAPEIPRRSVLYHASLSPDGSRILTTAWSGYAHLYDASSSLSVYEFQQQGGVVDAAFSPDGRHVATACEDGNAWLWTLADAVGHPLLLPQGNHIEEIAFNAGGAGVPAGRFLAVAGRGGHARVWDLSPPQPGVRRLPGDTVEWVVFDQSARRALLLSTDARSGIKIFDVPTGNLLGAASLKLGGSAAARFSPDGRRIVLFGDGSAALVLEADSARQLCPPLAHTHRVDDALWTPDSKFILTAAGPGGAQAWDPATGRPVATFPHSNSVSAIAISSDGKQLAIAQAGGAVEIWETLACRRQAGPIMMPGTIHQLEFSPDGARLAIAAIRGTDGVVEVRDIATGAVIGRPLLHRDAVRAFQFSRDGRWLATACDDHTARVWEAATGEPVSPWLPHDFEVRQVEFSPDGTRLATLTRRGAFRLWCARTGEPITAPLQYERNAGTGRFSYSPDGQRLLICRGGNEAWLRELQPETASLEELRLLAEVLSCTRFDPAAGMVPLDESSLDEAWKQLGALRKSRQSNLSAKAR